MSELRTEKKQNKIQNWLTNPYNAAMVLVVVVAFAVRLFFFVKTQGQTLWWDEADYMAVAKNWAFGIPFDYNPQRPPLFQALAALAFTLGLGEEFIKFTLALLPSTALVVCIYYLGKEMFNEKVGLISAILATVSWTFLFWTSRFQPDFFSMTFQVLAVLFMWKHWKKPNIKFVIYSGIFVALGFYFKISALLVPMIFMIFIAIKDRLTAFKDKHYYYFSAAFLLTLLPYFIWSFIKFNTPFAFRAGYTPEALVQYGFGWYNLKFYAMLTDNVLFIVFLIGVIIGLRFILYSDLLIKDKTKCFNPELFSILALAFISAFYIFYMRNTDDRWVFLWLPFIFMLAGKTLERVENLLKKYNRFLGIGIALVILGICIFNQLNHASLIINDAEPRYAQVKNAALWMKANSNPGDVIFSVSLPQTAYYSERTVLTYSMIPQMNVTQMDDFVNEHKPRYITFSAFETHPPFTQEWITAHQTDLKLVHTETEGTQQVLWVFEVQYLGRRAK